MRMIRALAMIAPLLVAGCGDRQAIEQTQTHEANAATPAVATAAPKDDATVLGSETVHALFTGWEMGDFAWAELRINNGRELSARVGGSLIDVFLTAHVGVPLVVTVETARAKAGDKPYARIAAASADGVDAGAWWARLSAPAQEAARAAAEAAMTPIG